MLINILGSQNLLNLFGLISAQLIFNIQNMRMIRIYDVCQLVWMVYIMLSWTDFTWG